MSYDDGGWPSYVSVAERRRKAARALEQLRKRGHPVAPVVIEGRAIAATVWGKAWCDNLESYRDYESRLPRGRTYVRNGSVIDLQIAPREVTALVSGSSIYKVTIQIGPVAATRWKSICTDCAGGIDSLVELLQGRLSKGVMERLCRQDAGLFPKPSDIGFSCSCLDHASMCKHVAAALYGVGARLDRSPELLFRLRAVDEKDLLAKLDQAMPASNRRAGKILDDNDVSALFGLDMSGAEAAPLNHTATTKAKTKPAPTRKSPKAARIAATGEPVAAPARRAKVSKNSVTPLKDKTAPAPVAAAPKRGASNGKSSAVAQKRSGAGPGVGRMAVQR